jgi:hypothetical protein
VLKPTEILFFTAIEQFIFRLKGDYQRAGYYSVGSRAISSQHPRESVAAMGASYRRAREADMRAPASISASVVHIGRKGIRDACRAAMATSRASSSAARS